MASIARLITKRYQSIYVPDIGLESHLLGELEVAKPWRAKAKGHWVAKVEWSGTAERVYDDEGKERELVEWSVSGLMTLCVFEGDLRAIVAPPAKEEPAVWLTHPLANLGVTSSGAQGALRKRPEHIGIEATDAWSASLREVDQVYLAIERIQSGREKQLLQALEGG